MRWFCIALMAVLGLVGCTQEATTSGEGEATVVLTVHWQRMVTSDGATCDRCGSTRDELGKAVDVLRESLAPLGVTVESTEEELTTEEFASDVIGSNRIMIGGRLLEDWLDGATGQSPCESCCEAVGDDVECRTVTVDGTTYDAVPAELIVRAGLVAAAELMRPPSSGAGCSCAGGDSEQDAPCCPGSARDEGATS